MTVLLDPLAIQQCYGFYNGTEWEWQAGTPADIVDDCDPNELVEDCAADLHDEIFDGDVTEIDGSVVCPDGDEGWCCPCALGEAGDLAPDECCYDDVEGPALAIALTQDELYTEWHDLTAELCTVCEDVNPDWCTGTPPYTLDITCVNISNPDDGTLSSLTCDAGAAMTGEADAEFYLNINPDYSYVTIHNATGDHTFALAGGGAGSSTESAFIAAIVTAANGSLGSGVVVEDWRFWFSSDIDVNVQSGDFTVDDAQGYFIDGGGQYDDDWYQAVFEPTADATGHFYTSTWYLNYYSTFAGGWVSIHLQGAKTSAP